MTVQRRTFIKGVGVGAAAAGMAAAGASQLASAQSSLPAGVGNLPGAALGRPIGTIIDYATGPPAAAALRAAGHLGAIRYCSDRRPGAGYMTGKPLLRREVDDFRSHGLAMVSCYQFGKGESADWLGGAEAGHFHAPIGIRIHRDAGGPNGVPMYVAIDDNPTLWQFENLIAPYLSAWRAVLGREGLKLGVYANAPTIAGCVARGLGSHFWQHDWGSARILNPAATIHQKAGRRWHVGGVNSDINDVYALDFGQWWPLDPMLAINSIAAGSSR